MLEKKLRQIPKTELIKGKWYLGRGRNSNIGYWNGRDFLVIGFNFDNPTIKVEGYYGKKQGCFQPFMLVDEGRMIEPFGKRGWENHYGKTLLVKLE
ncbi:MAG: hypothetical protein V1886_04460 [archaeon]